jgi:hypothetical protein
MSSGAAIRYGISMKLSFWLKRALTEQDRVAAALETAAYMRWVETREKRIAVLALSTNLDLVHAFITSTKFFEALDALACPQSE